MAEAVVGATIEVLLQNLLSFAVEEIVLIWNFNKDLENVKESVAMIRDFLEDAETKQVTDKSVKRWLMKLEEVAFNADYVFDELNYHVLRKRVQRDNKMKKKVRCFFPSFAFRHRMTKKIKDITNELKSINDKASKMGLQMRIAAAPSRGVGKEAPAYLETDSFSMDSVFVGRENEVTKIVEMVISGQTEEVISVFPIVGMGGLGKTTLARKVYNDGKIISHFGKRLWVHVSNNFDPVIVLKSILASSTGENVDGSRDVVCQKLQKSLGDKKFILVLDDVWNDNNDKWSNFLTSVKGISSVKGNVIMVTTRSGDVATFVKTLDIHDLGVLSDQECWLIIKAEAFAGEGIPSQFETIGANIAKRCGGLPLAAQVVGSLLRGKSKDEWVSIEKNWLSNFGDDENTVSKILKLSFDNLPSASVKKCFTFCSIIPKGWWIEKDELIELWMAEGLLLTDQEKDMEIVGNKVVNVLVQSSLLQVWQRDCYGNVKCCGMHDLVHDLASSVLYPKFLDNTCQVRYICRPFINESAHIPKEHAKGLRALFFGSKVSHIVFSNFKCLHVLILIDEYINELPIEIKKLISLRYLDISHTRIECLPDSISNLYHLQTLRATKEYGGESYLRKLPDTFKFLINLRQLYIPNIKLPPGIGKLIYLQTLPYFQVGDEEGCGIMELGSMKNLKGEIEIHNLEKVGDKEEAETAKLFHKPNIFKLTLVWNASEEGETNHENVLEGLQPHPNLKSLEINGFKNRSFPLWTSRMEVREDLEGRWVGLNNLIELKLSGCKECEEIPMLGHLPHLKFLYLHGLTNVKSLGSSFYGIDENRVYKESVIVFPVLERLELIDMENLMAWEEVDLPGSSVAQPREVSVFCGLEYLKMTNLPSEMIESCVASLEDLSLTESKSLMNLPQLMSILQKMPRLAVLGIEKVPKFTDVAAEIGSLRSLQILYIGGSSDCSDFFSFKASLDRFFPVLQSLRCLTLYGMEHWDALPDHLQHLTALHWLNLNNFGIQVLPEWLGNLSSLKTLHLSNCRKLRHLPSKKAMQNLTKLIELHIFECPLLEHSLKQEARNDDSEWFKISHIPAIMINERPIPAHTQ